MKGDSSPFFYFCIMKKIISFVVLNLVLVLILLFFAKIEAFFLDTLHFSWTFSKVIPYLLLLILGFVWSKKLLSFIPLKRVLVLRIIRIALIFVPFAIGFALHPIYEGDFSKNGSDLATTISYSEIKKTDLLVITIPNCPYCYEAIGRLKKMKQRNPKLRITYVVCTSDKKLIETYKKEVDGVFKVTTAKNPEKMAELAGFSFPAFVQFKENKPVYRWSNSQFGVRAIDLIESLH